MKTAKEILEGYLRVDGTPLKGNEWIIDCMEEYRSQRTESKELPGDEESGVIAVNIASNVKPRLTENEEAFFIAGFQECIKYLRTSPLLASRDARIRELEERVKLLEIEKAELIELNLTPPKN